MHNNFYRYKEFQFKIESSDIVLCIIHVYNLSAIRHVGLVGYEFEARFSFSIFPPLYFRFLMYSKLKKKKSDLTFGKFARCAKEQKITRGGK